MIREIEVQAPWATPVFAADLVDEIRRLPPMVRKQNAVALGRKLGVTNAVRERLRLWTISPCDMDAVELAKQLGAKERARKTQRRRQAGVTPRQIYLEQSRSKEKPWKAAGVSRATWYRQQRETCVSRTKLLLGTDRPVSPPDGQHCDSASSIAPVQASYVQRVEAERKPRKLNGRTCLKKDDTQKIWRAPRISYEPHGVTP